MSFKREGDDKGLLDYLRRRRIKELLGEDIPEDEAKLLCNGRFACLVCGHKPVFDTVNMLMVHRHGKKHAASEAECVRKKKELKALILRRKQEQYMKDGTTNIRQAESTSLGGILSTQPYDPCVKRHKAKPYERKARLDLRSPTACSQSKPQSSSSHAFTDPVPKKHGPQLKNIFRPSQTWEAPATPYVRQHRTHSDSGRTTTSCHQPGHGGVHTVASSSSSSVGQSSSPTFGDRSQLSGSLSSTASSSSSSPRCGSYKPPPAASSSRRGSSSASVVGRGAAAGHHPRRSEGSAGCADTGGRLSGGHCTTGVSGVQGKDGAEDGRLTVSGCADAAVGQPGAGVGGCVVPPAGEKTKVLVQKYYQISGSGWKKDWDGQWIRDEDAEFDSDEEPPDLP